MNKLFSTAVAIGCVSVFGSCHMRELKGAGEKTTNTVNTSSCTSLDISIPAKAEITVQAGAEPSVKISGYNNLLDHIKTSNNGCMLKIYSDLTDGRSLDSHAGTIITVVMPSLSVLELSGATDANIHGAARSSKFELSISGASNVAIDSIFADEFNTSVSGAASIAVNGGAAKRVKYALSGASKIYAFPFITGTTIAEISGAGRAEVNATDTLSASVSGTGTIHYKGHPQVQKEVSGVGSVKDAN